MTIATRSGSSGQIVRGWTARVHAFMTCVRARRLYLLIGSLMTIFGTPAFGAIARDVTVSGDGATASLTLGSPSFSTKAQPEELLALIATDYLGGANTTVKSVSGGGLTWSLIKRTNVQSGSSEIWGAYSAVQVTNASVTANLSQSVLASITVMSFTGVNGNGAIGAAGSKSAATGAPAVSFTTSGSNSVVVGVGNDFDNALPRSVGAGQSLVHQNLTGTGDTYWVQMLTSPIASAGTTATLSDTAPAADRYNFSSVEILADNGDPRLTILPAP